MTERDSLPRAPAGLSARGGKFWRETVAEYELTGSELAILTEACRTLDDLDRLAEAIAAEGATTEGSQGQQVVHPALTEARGQRQTLHRLLSSLALPDEEGHAVKTARTTTAQAAAAARWGRKVPNARGA